MIGAKGIPFPGEGGGIERHVEELAVRFAAAGHRVTVYVRPHIVAERGEWKGVRLVALPSIRTKHLDTITHVLLASIHALFGGYDVIHYHGVGPSTLAWIPRLLAPRAKVLVTFHSQDRFHKKWGVLARAYLTVGEWTAVRIPHATVAVSHAIERYVKERFGTRIDYIPNGVTPEPVPSASSLKEFGLVPGEYVFTAARLVRHKGIHLLIEAWKGLATKTKLIIAGAPSYTDDYRDYLLRLAADDARVQFVGFQTGKKLAALYGHAALYAHPSESEGLSLSILEAMSYGTPVLISDIPENMEIIDHSGWAFRSTDVLDLRKKIELALADPKLLASVGERGKAYVSKHFSWDLVATRTLALYAKLGATG